MAKIFLPKSIRENEEVKKTFAEKPTLNSEKIVAPSTEVHKKFGQYESKIKVPKPCAKCGKIFEPYNRVYIHCNECRMILRNHSKFCEYCGKWHPSRHCCQCGRLVLRSLSLNKGLCQFCQKRNKQIEGVLIFGK
jgi:hypothetical protein